MSIDVNEILERQQQAQDTIMMLLQGTVARFEESLGLLKDFNTDGPEKTLSPALGNWIATGEKFIASMEEAKLFLPMVLKVQRPLSSNAPGFDTDPDKKKVCLIYNEDRSVCETMFIDDGALVWMGEDPKMYVTSRLWGDGTLQLIARIEAQPW